MPLVVKEVSQILIIKVINILDYSFKFPLVLAIQNPASFKPCCAL